MSQWWRNLLFAHWRIPVAQLAALLPAALEPDLYQGEAWLGVIPFVMNDVRPRALPGVPGAANFCELNVRTYVRPRHHPTQPPGVYFWSLDASSPLAVWGARTFFHLPYQNARMSCREEGAVIHYESHRDGAAFSSRYQPRPGQLADELHTWLTERYCLYTTDSQGHLYRGDIHHRRWQLQPADLCLSRNTMTQPLGLSLAAQPDALAFSRAIQVAIWPLRKLA